MFWQSPLKGILYGQKEANTASSTCEYSCKQVICSADSGQFLITWAQILKVVWYLSLIDFIGVK